MKSSLLVALCVTHVMQHG